MNDIPIDEKRYQRFYVLSYSRMTSWKDFSDKKTEELISMYQGNHANKKEAFFVLVDRFKKDLLEKCEINCTRYGHGVDVAEEIAEKTFQAYAAKGRFDPSKGKGKTVDESFQFYLYRTARNLLVDYYRTKKKEMDGNDYDGTEFLHHQLPEVSLDTMKTEARIRYETIQALPQSHRTVLLTYTAYEKKGRNLPKKLQEELRMHLGVKQNTIRSYKKEAMDKIELAISIYKMSKRSNE